MIAAILMLLFSTESYSQASKKLVDDYVFVLEEIFNSEDQDTVIFKNLQSHIDVREVSLGEVSLQYVRKGIELARKKGLTDWEAMLYDLLGNVHGTLGEKNNAEIAHEKSLTLYRILSSSSKIVCMIIFTMNSLICGKYKLSGLGLTIPLLISIRLRADTKTFSICIVQRTSKNAHYTYNG